MKLTPVPLDGLTLIQTKPVCDTRGQFVRLFCDEALSILRPGLHFAQINLSVTAERGTIRGLHYQVSPDMECKLIRCIRGRIFDVAIDLRADSPTFMRWHALELSADSEQQIFIPEGFAHGFQTLEDNVELLYMHTARWSPAHERGLRYNDPMIEIRWPLPVTAVSERDRAFPLLDNTFIGISA